MKGLIDRIREIMNRSKESETQEPDPVVYKVKRNNPRTGETDNIFLEEDGLYSIDEQIEGEKYSTVLKKEGENLKIISRDGSHLLFSKSPRSKKWEDEGYRKTLYTMNPILNVGARFFHVSGLINVKMGYNTKDENGESVGWVTNPPVECTIGDIVTISVLTTSDYKTSPEYQARLEVTPTVEKTDVGTETTQPETDYLVIGYSRQPYRIPIRVPISPDNGKVDYVVGNPEVEDAVANTDGFIPMDTLPTNRVLHISLSRGEISAYVCSPELHRQMHNTDDRISFFEDFPNANGITYFLRGKPDKRNLGASLSRLKIDKLDEMMCDVTGNGLNDVSITYESGPSLTTLK
ncbi:hypothetical protein ACFLZX_04970 [Nanoarchaeota archaeon]